MHEEGGPMMHMPPMQEDQEDDHSYGHESAEEYETTPGHNLGEFDGHQV